ncbi:hypothetical protein FB45DRAFT_386752 [Roridomyces roridus]|uniref:Uncharacterized protein n=1 Tax=Roridomyces roridus TaxID=1738132 RepID=A0AAD7B315_9AGAR|nr:hypothetical protein FB45DRAFT_386752 [Roridomyces roridus]
MILRISPNAQRPLSRISYDTMICQQHPSLDLTPFFPMPLNIDALSKFRVARVAFIRLLTLMAAYIGHGRRALLRNLASLRWLLSPPKNPPQLTGKETWHCSTQPVIHPRLGDDASSPTPKPASHEEAALGQVHEDGQDAVSPSASTSEIRAEPLLSSEHPTFSCTAPELLPRYTIRPTVAKTDAIPPIGPNTRSFIRDTPTSWEPHVSPEGALYYEHSSEFLRVITDSALHDAATVDGLMIFLHNIEEFWTTNKLPLDSQVEMVLDFVPGEDGQPPTCGYYLADHSRRIIFWYDTFRPEGLPRCFDVCGAFSSQHIKLELEAQYWYHCALFPSTLHMTPKLLHQLRDIVVFTIGDVMTSMKPPVDRLQPDMFDMLTLIDGFKDQLDHDADSAVGLGASFTLARFMWSFASYRFYQFHGEPYARLNGDASVFTDTPRTRSKLFRVTALLTFNVSWEHAQTLESIYTDEILSEVHWIGFIQKLYTEWQELTLYGTVLLNADIAFLSIPTLQNSISGNGTSVGEIACYISVIAGLGSILVSLAVMRQHRDFRDSKSIFQAAAFLGRRFHPTFGFESLAHMYSLPFALLIWATLAFLVAFLGMCFQSSDDVARSLVAATTFLAVLVVIRYCFLRNTSLSDWLLATGRVGPKTAEIFAEKIGVPASRIFGWWNREKNEQVAVGHV